MRIKNNYTHFKDNIEKNLFNEKQFLQKSSILSRQCRKNIYISHKSQFEKYLKDTWIMIDIVILDFFLKICRFMR